MIEDKYCTTIKNWRSAAIPSSTATTSHIPTLSEEEEEKEKKSKKEYTADHLLKSHLSSFAACTINASPLSFLYLVPFLLCFSNTIFYSAFVLNTHNTKSLDYLYLRVV